MNNINVWNKYLPALRIVLKRSQNGEQHFALNVEDFARAGFARKTGYRFLLNLKNGYLDTVIVDMPLASALVSALMGDPAIRELLVENQFHISMSTKYELTIKRIIQHQPETT